MDPDANLEEQRALVAKILEATNDPDDWTAMADPEDVNRLVELVQAMDGWLSGGGFKPKDWK